jgi:hypothetical protein
MNFYRFTWVQIPNRLPKARDIMLQLRIVSNIFFFAYFYSFKLLISLKFPAIKFRFLINFFVQFLLFNQFVFYRVKTGTGKRVTFSDKVKSNLKREYTVYFP